MFSLEQAISEWRRQMLAAGIKTPVPLEELEIHLRDEIERQMKSGLSKRRAFEIAVQQVGQPKILNSEFKKVEYGCKAKRVLRLIGWLAASAALWFGWFRFSFDWGLFSFHPNLHFDTIEDIAIIIVAEAVIWLLAKVNRDLLSRIASLVICLFLVGIAAIDYYYAAQPSRGFFGGIREPDPLWYRIGMTSLLFLPSGFWIWWALRHKIHKRDSIREVHSS